MRWPYRKHAWLAAMTLSQAAFYRLLHTGNDGDAAFYGRAAAGAERVLELGCGWGRLTKALVEVSPHVVGLDCDPDFVAMAAAEVPRARIVTGSMSDFSLDQTFERIVIPYNAVYCLKGETEALRCLSCVREHLAPAGQLWFDCYPADDFHEAALAGELPPDDDEPIARFSLDGRRLRTFEATEVDAQSQRLFVTYRALDEDGRELVRSTLRHDYFTSSQLLALVERAGLSTLLLAGGFDGRPFDGDAQQLVLGASR